MKRFVQSMVFLFVALGLALPSLPADAPGVVVGRVTHVEADLLRYVPEGSDWVAAIRDVPFAAGDAFYSGSQGRAELLVPNGSLLRVGSATQIQFLALDPDFAETDVAAGVVRLYNNGRDTVIKADSPFGYVLSFPGSAFDFYVGENSAEVVAVKGTVSFVHTATNARYDVSAGFQSILADRTAVASGEGAIDPDWDAWNMTREQIWAARARLMGPSAAYLPPALRSDAYILEKNGIWVKVFYEGRECWFWKPTTVAAGWAPFTMGRWSEWHGDQTWIPAEPFGYLTHHYGAWVLVGDQWYWAPPVARPGQPLLDVGFAWYPGRVSWIHSDGYVGWVPLAPRETYYARYAWGGPRVVVVTDITMGRMNVDVRNYAYAGRAVVVNQNNFYGVNTYRNVQVTNVSINNYRAAPVVNNTVINNYTNMRQKYGYSNAAVNEKPHASVVDRIRQNEKVIHEGRKENPVALGQQVKNIHQGNVVQGARVPQPKMTNYIVPAAQVNRPISEVALQQREVKTSGKAPGVRPGPQAPPGRPAGPAPAPPPASRPIQPVQKPQGPPPAPPQQSNVQVQKAGPPAPTPQGVAPARPGQGVPSTTVQPAPLVSKPQGPRPAQQASKPQGAPPAPPQQSNVQVQKAGPPAPTPQGVAPARPGQGVPSTTVQPAPLVSKPQGPRPAQQASKPQGAPPAPPQQSNVQVQKAGPPAPTPQGVAPARPGQGVPSSPPKKPAQPTEAKQGNSEKKAQDGK